MKFFTDQMRASEGAPDRGCPAQTAQVTVNYRFGVAKPSTPFQLHKANTMTLVLNNANILLVNSLRNLALKSASDFNAVKFFSDGGYAKTCLANCARSGVPELAILAAKVSHALFRPAPVQATRLEAGPSQPPASRSLAPGERFPAAKELMNSLVVDAVGLRSFLFVLKLERAQSCAELVALMVPFQKLLTKGMGDLGAAKMSTQVRRLLEDQS